MKDYRDMKPMKRSGHVFMADGGFTGSSGMQSVRPYTRKVRKTPGEPPKPDFKRRATTPGGLASGGLARTTSTEATVAGGKYAKGGAAKHSDVAADKAMVRTSVHKHEKALHKGKPLTKLARGGVPAYSKKPVLGSGC